MACAVQVHFRGFPKTTLSPWNGIPGLRAAYLNALKVKPLDCPRRSRWTMNNVSSMSECAWESGHSQISNELYHDACPS